MVVQTRAYKKSLTGHLLEDDYYTEEDGEDQDSDYVPSEDDSDCNSSESDTEEVNEEDGIDDDNDDQVEYHRGPRGTFIPIVKTFTIKSASSTPSQLPLSFERSCCPLTISSGGGVQEEMKQMFNCFSLPVVRQKITNIVKSMLGDILDERNDQHLIATTKELNQTRIFARVLFLVCIILLFYILYTSMQ
jgi:hypothetical protein